MPKKIIGKIKVTAKVTTRRTISYHHQYQTRSTIGFDSIPEQTHVSATPAVASLEKSVKSLESTIKKVSRPAKLPSGVYSPQVEQLYDEINKRSKSEEADEAAMYDVFISHASEDKKDYVQPLVEALQDAGIRVWYDALELEWGKSLRGQIDNGIKRSKYAILVLSKHFFAKKWPQRELDGILTKEDVTGTAPLPIWYNVTQEDVYNFSPTLAGLYSMTNARHSIADICQAFKLILNKEAVRNK